jgi:hypothetical protein
MIGYLVQENILGIEADTLSKFRNFAYVSKTDKVIGYKT